MQLVYSTHRVYSTHSAVGVQYTQCSWCTVHTVQLVYSTHSAVGVQYTQCSWCTVHSGVARIGELVEHTRALVISSLDSLQNSISEAQLATMKLKW